MEEFPITINKRPIFLQHEVELKIGSNILFLHGIQSFGPGNLVVTNLRAILIEDSSIGTAKGFNLSNVHRIEDNSNFFHRSTHIKIFFDEKSFFKIKFQSGDQVTFKRLLEDAYPKSKSFTFSQNSIVSPQKAQNSSVVGIGGILRKQASELQSIKSVTSHSLSDLESLMTNAQEVVQLLQRYAQYSVDTSLSPESGENSKEIENLLQNLGITSPVSKFSAGRLYHHQLSSEVSDLLLNQNRLERLGGMITLPDLFCVLNRARGTELVSPEDLRRAVSYLDSGPVQLRTFPSGLMVLSLSSLNDQTVVSQILHIIDSNPSFSSEGLQTLDLSTALNLSPLLARERLRLAEEMGDICRDESLRGIFYFKNRFN